MFHPLLPNFSMKAVVKHCAVLCLIIGLNVSLISCSGDETSEDFMDSQTSLVASDTPIDVEEMILIPAGEVRLGTDNKTDLTFGTEADTWTVFVAAFYIDKYEVTNKQYAKFLSETGHRKPKFWEDPRFNAPDQPVVGVNWEDAETYAIRGLVNDYLHGKRMGERRHAVQTVGSIRGGTITMRRAR